MRSSIHHRRRAREPLPLEDEEQQALASSIATGLKLKPKELQQARGIARTQRVAHFYQPAVVSGALALMKLARASQRRRGQKAPLDPGKDYAWATGVATGLTLPPYAAFSGPAIAEVCQRIRRTGVRRGVLLALHYLGLREAA